MRTTFKTNDDYKRMWSERTQPVVVRSLQDIKMALQPFLDADGKDVLLTAELKWQDGPRVEKAVVSCESKSSSLRDVLIEGMQAVKKRVDAKKQLQEAIKKAEDQGVKIQENMQAWEVDNLRFGVDALIYRKLGGKRHGCRIRWKVREGVYEFDPFSNKLLEIVEEHPDAERV